jgi:hypothetical protein
VSAALHKEKLILGSVDLNLNLLASSRSTFTHFRRFQDQHFWLHKLNGCCSFRFPYFFMAGLIPNSDPTQTALLFAARGGCNRNAVDAWHGAEEVDDAVFGERDVFGLDVKHNNINIM